MKMFQSQLCDSDRSGQRPAADLVAPSESNTYCAGGITPLSCYLHVPLGDFAFQRYSSPSCSTSASTRSTPSLDPVHSTMSDEVAPQGLPDEDHTDFATAVSSFPLPNGKTSPRQCTLRNIRMARHWSLRVTSLVPNPTLCHAKSSSSSSLTSQTRIRLMNGSIFCVYASHSGSYSTAG